MAPLLASCLHAATDADVFRALEKRGIPIGVPAAQARAAEAVLKEADPLGRIVSADEARDLLNGEAILQADEWEEGICYLKLGGLFAGSQGPVLQRIRGWAAEGRSGLILDARGAGGNSFEALNEIAGALALRDRVTATGAVGERWRLQRAGGEDLSLGAIGRGAEENGSSVTERLPVMLLVDEGTSGASELLAATMKRRRGVMVLGNPTGGDAALREIVPLTDTEVMFVSTAWLIASPDGGATNAFSFVEPDVIVSAAYTNRPAARSGKPRPDKGLSEKAVVDRELMARVAGDAVLLRAVDILLGLKALGLYGSSENRADPSGP
jgi:C-terminal processing protease CtpA/Prc